MRAPGARVRISFKPRLTLLPEFFDFAPLDLFGLSGSGLPDRTPLWCSNVPQEENDASGFVSPPRASVKRLSSIVSEVQTKIAFQLHHQVAASLFCGMGPKVPAERLRQSLYTVRRIRRCAIRPSESRTPKLRTVGQAPAVLKCFTALPLWAAGGNRIICV